MPELDPIHHDLNPTFVTNASQHEELVPIRIAAVRASGPTIRRSRCEGERRGWL